MNIANLQNHVLCLFCQLFLYILGYFPKSPYDMLFATRTISCYVLSYANTIRTLIPMGIWNLLFTNELLIVVVRALLAAPSSQQPLCCFQPQLPVLPKHFSKLCGKLVTKWKTIVSTLNKPRESNLQYILIVVVRNYALKRKGYREGSNWTSRSFDFFFFGGMLSNFLQVIVSQLYLKPNWCALNYSFLHTLAKKLKVNFGPDLFQWKFRISSSGGGYNITIISGNVKIIKIERHIKIWSCSHLSCFVKPMSYMPSCLEFCYDV